VTKKYEQFYQALISIVACSFPIICLASGKGYNYSAMLLLLCAMITLPYWCNRRLFTRPIITISITFFVYFLTYLLSWLIHGGDAADIDQVSRLVLILPVLYMLTRFPINKQCFFYAICVGAIIAGVIALIHIYQINFQRAFTGDNNNWWLKGYMPIQSGNMAMSLGFLALTISFYAFKTNQRLLVAISLLGFFAGTLASFLSGSRGAWIAIPFAIIYLLWANRELLNKKRLTIISLFGIITILGISSIDQVQQRFSNGISDLNNYENQNKYSSLGIRLELWKNAILTFKESPIIGVGQVERYTLQKKFGDQGLIDYNIAHSFFSHAHNQYLDDLSIRGLIGFSALLAVFLIPIVLCSNRYVDLSNSEQKLSHQLIVMHILLFAFYLVSQAMFSHNSGTIFFSVMTISLFSLVYNHKKPSIQSPR